MLALIPAEAPEHAQVVGQLLLRVQAEAVLHRTKGLMLA